MALFCTGQERKSSRRFRAVARRGSRIVDVVAYNREAWDRAVARGNRWTVPVGPEVIAAARRGAWEVVLTPPGHPLAKYLPAFLATRAVR